MRAIQTHCKCGRLNLWQTLLADIAAAGKNPRHPGGEGFLFPVTPLPLE